MRMRLSYIFVAIPLTLAPALTACGPKVNLSGLDAEGLSNYKRATVAKYVNDVTASAIAAHSTNHLTTAATAQVLTINKQVLDVLVANPATWQEKVTVVVKNARDALPADVNMAIGGYIQQVVDFIAEVTK